jgi:hypothetical protein
MPHNARTHTHAHTPHPSLLTSTFFFLLEIHLPFCSVESTVSTWERDLLSAELLAFNFRQADFFSVLSESSVRL